MTKQRQQVKWRFPTKRADGDTVRRSVCNRYELIEGASAKAGKLWTITLNPDAKGTFDFRVLFIERDQEGAIEKLEAYEAKRLAATPPAAGLEDAA